MFSRVIRVGCQKAVSIGNSIVKRFSMSLPIFVLYFSFCRRNKHLGFQLSSQFQMKMLKCWHVCRVDNLILIELYLIYFPQTHWFVWVFSKFTVWKLIVPSWCKFLTHRWDHLLYLYLSDSEAQLTKLLSVPRREKQVRHSRECLIPDFTKLTCLSLEAWLHSTWQESKVWTLEQATLEIPKVIRSW